MPQRDPITGLTVQQETFARAVSIGKSQADAYREAYPRSLQWKDKSVHEKASAMAAQAKVMARVAFLREEAQKDAVYDVKTAMAEANEALVIARATASAPNIVKAVKLKCEIAGLLVKKIEMVEDPLKDLTHEEAKHLLELLEKAESHGTVVAAEPGPSPVASAVVPSRTTH